MRRITVLLVALCFAGLFAGTAFADTTIHVHAATLTDHECDSSEWHFVINQVDTEAHAPSSIHVTWANGDEADLALSKFTGGVAHYASTSNLDSTVTDATATIYDGWSGQFNLSHGPCAAEPTPSPSPTPCQSDCETPTPTPTPTPTWPSGCLLPEGCVTPSPTPTTDIGTPVTYLPEPGEKLAKTGISFTTGAVIVALGMILLGLITLAADRRFKVRKNV